VTWPVVLYRTPASGVHAVLRASPANYCPEDLHGSGEASTDDDFIFLILCVLKYRTNMI